MLNLFAIILTLTALVGIIILVSRKIPELREQEISDSYPSWSKREFLKKILSNFWDWLINLVDRIKNSLHSAKRDGRNAHDIAKHFGDVFRSKLQRRKQVSDVVVVDDNDNELDKAEEFFEQGQFVKAEEITIEFLKDNPTSKFAYELLGRIYVARKSYPEAAEVYRFLVKKSPSDDKYWYSLGKVLSELEDYQEAVKAYLRSLDIYTNPEVFMSLGLAYQGMENYQAAGATFESALDIDPENTQVLFLLAENFLHRNDDESAVRIFEQILEIDPSNHIAKER